MGRTMVKISRGIRCPSCGASIRFRCDRNRIGNCPKCGDLLMQRNRLNRRLEVVDEEGPPSAMDGAEEFEREISDKIE